MALDPNMEEGLKKFKEQGEEKKKLDMARWEKEIQGLQTRTAILEIEEMDLGNGVNIALRTNLTQAEAELLDTYKAKMQIAQKEGNVKLAREYSYKLYSLVTANPLITEEWCAKNTDKYNLMDMTVLIAKFGDILTEKTMRIVKAQSFRSK